ncbi:hypothetical protein N8017_01560 [Crocinitomicaceae bacterium]|nr:hypothetical protein [Crocinitomicaceae bacterium]MDC1243892.1 hypothetical protein [Crocinitomicaceae bacterium]MDC1361645.1 hypothetical protein [Crocinitomicaceae bacterium]
MKGLIIFIGICVLFSCKTKQNSETTVSQNNSNVIDSGIIERDHPSLNIEAEIGDMTQESKNVQILKSKIDGNHLILKIGYSGGCTTHEFQFLGSAMISKSLPPIRTVRLVHHTDDTCREYIERELIVNLKDLAYKKESGSKIKLKIQGAEDFLLYTYQ